MDENDVKSTRNINKSWPANISHVFPYGTTLNAVGPGRSPPARGAWAPAGDSFFTRIKMTETQSSELIIEDQVIDISSKTEPDPHILILSSGEMTPFEWRIQDQYSQNRIVLQGNILGGVLMTGPEPLG